MSKRILVAYATGSGSTREVAAAIAEELAQEETAVEVHHASEVTDLSSYSAVILGSSIHFGRWLSDAVQFLETFKDELSDRPVAYFTTCLTMVDATEDNRRTVLAYLEPILQLAPDIQPVGLGLFAGSLDPNRRLIMPAGTGLYGDFRDWDTIRAWARKIRPALLEGIAMTDGKTILAQAIGNYPEMARVNLSQADLSATELDQANLQESDLSQANLREAGLNWVDLTHSNLKNADLRGANLIGANLIHARMQGANLNQAILNGANLRHTDLRQAQLQDADLNWADLRDADLSNANLSHANIGWANFKNAKLEQVNLSKARYNSQTKWPDDFSAEEAGCIFISGPY